MVRLKHLIIIVVVICTAKVSGKSIGDLCLLNKTTGVTGICKLFKECNTTRINLNSGILPEACGLQEGQTIVCCEKKPGEISNIKCKDYSQYVYEYIQSPVPLIDDFSLIKKNSCGHKVEKLIIGGEPANKKEFPHMALIGFSKNDNNSVIWACGGTLISEFYVLTAGHCLHSKYGPAKYVQIGITKVHDQTVHKQEFTIAELKPHPEYIPPRHYHDIGLVKLDKPVKLNPYAIPACLHWQEEIDAEKAIVTGWGATNDSESSEDLLKVTLDLYNYTHCSNSYKNLMFSRKLPKGILNDIQLCAGFDDDVKVKDACQGDSGGPLQIYHVGDNITCMYDIIGIISFGQACLGSTGGYTRISHYIKWIEDIAWQ